MDEAALWQRYQDWLYYHEGLGIYVDVSRMSFDEAFVEQLTPRFEQAFEAMADLEDGAIANPDENRMVGHYWLRNPDLAPSEALKQDIHKPSAPSKRLLRRCAAGEITPPGESRFTDILSVGIGGSALGPQFVSKALTNAHPDIDIHFIDNTDPVGIDHTLRKLAPPQKHAVFCHL